MEDFLKVINYFNKDQKNNSDSEQDLINQQFENKSLSFNFKTEFN